MTAWTVALRRAASRCGLVAALALTGAIAPPAAAQVPVPPLVLSQVTQDAATDTITIVGEHFGSEPFVTLDLVPLDVRLALETSIMAAVPIDAMPPGQYLLTVSRGPAVADRASLEVTLGSAPPAGARPPVSPPVSPPASPPASVTLPPAAGEVAAVVGDRSITIADLDREWHTSDPGSYAALMRQLYQQRRAAADRLVNTDLLSREATARGLTPDALLAAEVPTRVIATPDGAVTALYESLGDRTRGAALDRMRPALRAWLERKTEPELAKMAYLEELTKTATRVELMLTAPQVQVEQSALDPALGPASAPVEIIAFGDLQSPDYVRLAAAFGRVRDTFGGRVRIVFKLLPVFGPQSASAAEAGACAHVQGRFWDFHDAAARPGTLDARRLRAIPEELGLNRRAFEQCLTRGEFRDRARLGLAEAGRYGITSGPSLLVNGRLAPPVPPFLPPFEYVKRLIEEELQRQAKAARKGGP